MGRENVRSKRRKVHRSEDSDEERRLNRDRSPTESPERKSRKLGGRHERSPSTQRNVEESLSIDETNKLRASLGLAPLELDDQSKIKTLNANGEKTFVEHGIQIVHKAPEHIGDKKKAEELRQKIETMKEKRRLYNKVLKRKCIANADVDDLEDTVSWVAKSRSIEKERKQAEERAKMLDKMDAEFGVDSFLDREKAQNEKERKSKQTKQQSDAANLLIGHDKGSFLQSAETILVLEDRNILEDAEEILINPNLVENEMHAKNVDRRKKKDRYEPYAEDVDDFGMLKSKGVLSKYDEELDGDERKAFRLDEKGEFNLDHEKYEAEMKKRLMMVNKKLDSLESPQYKVANEFYTQEEMISFRKNKKTDRKIRKRKEKVLKADDLLPDEGAMKDDLERASVVAARYRERESGVSSNKQTKSAPVPKLEDGELVEEDDEKREEKWHAAKVSGIVDMQRISKIVEENNNSSDSDDDLIGNIGLTDVLIEDEAESELTAILDRTRKLRNSEKKEVVDPAIKVYNMVKQQQIKEEPIDSLISESSVVIDSTMEYCHNLGEVPYPPGEKDLRTDEQIKVSSDVMEKTDGLIDDNDDDDEDILEEARLLREQRAKESRHAKGRWFEATATTSITTVGELSDNLRSADKDNVIHEAYSLLGEERDASKGVAAVLKLAASKGYLDNFKEKKVNGPSLKHLQSQNCCQIESSRYDMDEKYTKKLERMGTTGTGPIRSFPEKSDYKPDVRIDYVDEKGREMDPKDAFRVLSWKFHGKGPGKKQVEKRLTKISKKETMKKMNSFDTPLGTLNKQKKKQEVLQTPYIILSGTGRDTGAPLKKD